MDKKIDIAHIARLARLRIAEEHLNRFEQDMETIIAMVDGLPEACETPQVDAGNPMTLRKDAVTDGDCTRDEMLQNAPEVQNSCLVVPKTVE